MKNRIWILIFLLLTTTVFAAKVATLPGELAIPSQIVFDNNQLYVVDGVSIYIYSLKDFKLIKKIGKMGEGPREFKIQPGRSVAINVQADSILINSVGRVSFFSKDGKYIGEANNISGKQFKPMGKQFVGYKSVVDKEGVRYATTNIFDSQFKILKELQREESIVQRGKGWHLFSKSFSVSLICDKKIFALGVIKDFAIDVFDFSGKKAITIKEDYKNIKFTEQLKARVLNHYKTDPNTKANFDWWKNNIHLPEYFPAIRDLHTCGKKRYVRTYRVEGKNAEFYIYNSSGKLLKRRLITIAENTARFAYPFKKDSAPHAFKDDKLYQLIENLENESWELYETKID